MFLIKLYKYSKSLFLLFTGFLLAFLFINWKQGAVVTPIYQYGMFSEKFHLHQSYEAYSFYVDDEKVSLRGFSFPYRDILLVSLSNYKMREVRNSVVPRSLLPFLGPVLRSGEAEFTTAASNDFNQWYVKMASRIFKRPISSLEVFRHEVFWKNGLIVSKSAQKIFPIAEQ